MLNRYTAPGKENRFPADLVIPFAEVTGSDALQRFLLGPRLRKLLQLAEAELNAERDGRALSALREELLADK
jgi:hypothetical protein